MDNSQSSYGASLNANGGAVIVMEWTERGIKICAFASTLSLICSYPLRLSLLN